MHLQEYFSAYMASCVYMTAADGLYTDVLFRRKVSLEQTGLTISIQTWYVRSATLTSSLERNWAGLMNKTH